MSKAEKLGIILFLLIGFIVITLFNTIMFVQTGEIGIVKRFGAVQERVLSEGMNFKVPFIESVTKIDCRIQKLDNEASSASKDLQDVKANVTINYNIDVTKAPTLFKTVGTSYADIILKPTITDAIKGEIAKYTAEELIAKRSEVTEVILSTLNTRLNVQGITITNVSITNLQFSDAFNQAIEDKQIAQQNTLKAKEELEKAKVESEKKIVEATATAEANKLQEQSLTPGILTKMAIDKWSGSLPTTMASDTIPFLNIK